MVAWMNARGPRADPRHPAHPLLVAVARRRSGRRARRRATASTSRRSTPTATGTRCWSWRTRKGSPATRGAAPASSPAWTRRRARRASPDAARRRAGHPRRGGSRHPVETRRAPRGLVRLRASCRRRRADRAEGRRGGRRGDGRGPRGGIGASRRRGGGPLVPHARAAGGAGTLGAPCVRGARSPAPAGGAAGAREPRPSPGGLSDPSVPRRLAPAAARGSGARRRAGRVRGRAARGRELRRLAKGYRVGAPAGLDADRERAPMWRSGARTPPAGLMAHATCEGKPPARPLPILARHLRFGLRDVQDLVETPACARRAARHGPALPGHARRRPGGRAGADTRGAAGCVYDLVGGRGARRTRGARAGLRALRGRIRRRRDAAMSASGGARRARARHVAAYWGGLGLLDLGGDPQRAGSRAATCRSSSPSSTAWGSARSWSRARRPSSPAWCSRSSPPSTSRASARTSTWARSSVCPSCASSGRCSPRFWSAARSPRASPPSWAR